MSLWELIAAVLGVDQSDISDSTSAADLPAWDSLAHALLTTAIESEFRIQIDPGESLDLTSYRAVALFLGSRGL